MRILLVEENKSPDNDIKTGLKKYGYTVDPLEIGETLLSCIRTETFDVIVLDLNLSDPPGLNTLRKIREVDIRTPVLILTGSKSSNDNIKVLNNGADYYLTKPADLEEVSARIRALHRHSNNRASPLLTYQNIELNLSTSSVTFKGKDINFSRREFSLLQKLLENVGHVVSRTSLNQCLYGWADEVDSNAIEVHVHNIRKKLANTHFIQTIRGIGYRVVKENI
ncbi:MAG: response regulator transcription factor [Gammaproteobacteria bacterium]|nr:MAG: response regulator transcription factor [Gammaproteobacteria bacterium]